MRYDYLKTAKLDAKARSRLRVMIRLERRLRGHTRDAIPPGGHRFIPAGAKEMSLSAALVDELFELFRAPRPDIRQAVIDWALCYTPPRLLSQLIDAAAAADIVEGSLGVLARARAGLLLPRDYIVPDFQSVQLSVEAPRRALVCFTGNGKRLNVPVQLFHLIAAPYFDQVIYLRDPGGQRFIHGIRGLGDSLETLAVALKRFVPAACHTAVLSTSSGGVAAARVAELAGFSRAALFSPEYAFKQVAAVVDHTLTSPNNTRIYFATHSAVDRRFAEGWENSAMKTSIQWLQSTTHGTLAHLIFSDDVDELLQWLGGKHSTSTS